MDATLRKRLIGIFSDGFLVLYFLFALFPIVWMVLVSLKSTDELFTTQFIFTPTLDNYQAILFGDARASAGVIARQEFPRNFMNSFIVSSGAVIVSLLVGVPAAYALARYNFKGKENLAFTFLESSLHLPLVPVCTGTGGHHSALSDLQATRVIRLLLWDHLGISTRHAAPADLGAAELLRGHQPGY